MTLDNFNERLHEAQQPAPNTEWKLQRLTIAVEVLGIAVASLEQRIAALEQYAGTTDEKFDLVTKALLVIQQAGLLVTDAMLEQAQ